MGGLFQASHFGDPNVTMSRPRAREEADAALDELWGSSMIATLAALASSSIRDERFTMIASEPGSVAGSDPTDIDDDLADARHSRLRVLAGRRIVLRVRPACLGAARQVPTFCGVL